MPVWEFGAATHRGTIRAVNQDSLLAAPPVFVVADGIGGNDGGELASQAVTEEFARLVGRADLLPSQVADALEAAHRRVLTLGQEHAGTTAVGAVAVVIDSVQQWVIFNIGDSRIYRRSAAGGFSQLSVDHSHVQELVEAGVITAEESLTHPERNLVTRAIGADARFEPDFWLLPMVVGERLMICSDGLLRESPYDRVQELVTGSGSAAQVAEELLQLSLAWRASDNVSVIIVDVCSGEEDDRLARDE